GDARELILRERLLPFAGGHAVPRARRDPQKRRDFIPAEMPMRGDPLHGSKGHGTQAGPISLVRESVRKPDTWPFLGAEIRIYHLMQNIASFGASRKRPA